MFQKLLPTDVSQSVDCLSSSFFFFLLLNHSNQLFRKILFLLAVSVEVAERPSVSPKSFFFLSLLVSVTKEKERERERKKERKKERDKDRKKERETKTEREKERKKERERERKRETKNRIDLGKRKSSKQGNDRSS